MYDLFEHSWQESPSLSSFVPLSLSGIDGKMARDTIEIAASLRKYSPLRKLLEWRQTWWPTINFVEHHISNLHSMIAQRT